MSPLLLDIGAPEFLLLAVIAVILFGPEKLPELARKTARVVNYLRGIASNAQDSLSRELGPGFENLDIRDLHPKTFLRHHLLDDVEPIVADVKSDFADATSAGRGAAGDLADAVVAAQTDSASELEPVAVASRLPTPWDPDAT